MTLNLFDDIDCTFLSVIAVLIIFIGFNLLLRANRQRLLVCGLFSGIIIAKLNLPAQYINLHSSNMIIIANLAMLIYMVILGAFINLNHSIRNNVLFVLFATILYISLKKRIDFDFIVVWNIYVFIMYLVVRPILNHIYKSLHNINSIAMAAVLGAMMFSIICGMIDIPQVLGGFLFGLQLPINDKIRRIFSVTRKFSYFMFPLFIAQIGSYLYAIINLNWYLLGVIILAFISCCNMKFNLTFHNRFVEYILFRLRSGVFLYLIVVFILFQDGFVSSHLLLKAVLAILSLDVLITLFIPRVDNINWLRMAAKYRFQSEVK